MEILIVHVTGTGPKLKQVKLPTSAKTKQIDDIALDDAEALYSFLYRSVTAQTFQLLKKIIEDRQ